MSLVKIKESAFAKEVRTGLSDHPKHLSSKYFYDAKGSDLFELIMRMPSYYLTDCEYEIFEQNRAELLEQFAPDGAPFQLIEFGAGDGLKTRLLLEHFLNSGATFEYLPIDISGQALKKLTLNLKRNFPKLQLKPMEAEYFTALHQLKEEGTGERKVVLFLGSNIGNFNPEGGVVFLKHMREELNRGDQLLIGFDLKKDPAVVLEAYNDKTGITRAFNLNLLRRINRELGGNFDLDQFDHWESYDPLSGECRSYIMSKCRQTVRIEVLDESYQFQAWEPIWTELSQKFDIEMIHYLAEASGFKVRESFTDHRNYFLDVLCEAV